MELFYFIFKLVERSCFFCWRHIYAHYICFLEGYCFQLSVTYDFSMQHRNIYLYKMKLGLWPFNESDIVPNLFYLTFLNLHLKTLRFSQINLSPSKYVRFWLFSDGLSKLGPWSQNKTCSPSIRCANRVWLW